MWGLEVIRKWLVTPLASVTIAPAGVSCQPVIHCSLWDSQLDENDGSFSPLKASMPSPLQLSTGLSFPCSVAQVRSIFSNRF